jgi:hypothetical protein
MQGKGHIMSKPISKADRAEKTRRQIERVDEQLLEDFSSLSADVVHAEVAVVSEGPERKGRRNLYTLRTHVPFGLPTQRDTDIESLLAILPARTGAR